MLFREVLRTLCCLGPSDTHEELPSRNDDPPSSSPKGPDNDLLSPDRLRQDIVDACQRDERLKPFMTLFRLIDDPNIDFTSDAVKDLLHDIHKINKDIEQSMEQALPPTSSPFFSDDDTVERVDVSQFSNWGKTVEYNTPYTFVVRSIKGLGKVVRWAKEQGKKVRAAGFRHSWSDVFGTTGDVTVMFLPYSVLTQLPYQQPSQDFTNSSELLGISIVPDVLGKPAPAGKAFCKIMAGTTNDMFRQWCFDHKKWCIPLNVIMVEITFGGSNAPVCHGAGLRTQTLSDLVRVLEYVDANEDKQTVSDPHELRAAAGSFGLLGIVVSLTMEIDDMYVVDLVPAKVPVALAVPPPKDYPIPRQIQNMMTLQGITEKQLDQARDDFISRCENDYYLEWFWFPYQEDAWVNTWTRRPITDQDLSLDEYPGSNWLTGVKSQEIQGTLAEAIINFTPFRWLPGRHQAFLFSAATLFALPDVKFPKDAIKTYQSEALHFRRGIQNFRVWDSEWEIPIPKGSNGKLNLEIAQRAWWDGITAIYSREDAPVRVALEMRLTGGSDVLLAPQRGNVATASIEVLTTLITPQDDWATFMQQIADKWTSYDLGGEAGATHPRPHWAKQWSGVQVHGKPIERYLREDAYREAFEEFRTIYADILAKRGLTVEDTLRVFGNAMMQRLIWGDSAAQ